MNECNTSGNENRSYDHESTSSRIDADADIGSSNNSNTLLEVYNDLFKNMFAYGIQSHEQPESISDTYEVNENNSNIISNIPNMDPDRNKEEHDYVDYEQHRALFASLINNLKYDVEKSCEKDKTFAKENGKFDELRKAGQTDQTLRMLLPKEENVNTGK
ncbi:hypothetical protein Tco_0653369 [Tanacetum coccineum]|uniref:Uncharacterized protein n=1 Tax=Tanacetum coccineum TaxID=301880 RepID=A0ABQ4X0Z9_9ASTR